MLKNYNELLRIIIRVESPLCLVFSWVIKRVYTILISNTISGSSNLDNCFYHCLILTLISHLKDLFNSLLTYIYIYIYIYIFDLHVDRPRSCRVIYYFDTSALGIRHQLFDRVRHHLEKMKIVILNKSFIYTKLIFLF